MIIELVREDQIYDLTSSTPSLIAEPFTTVNQFYLLFTTDAIRNHRQTYVFFHYFNPIIKLDLSNRKYNSKHSFLKKEVNAFSSTLIQTLFDKECLCDLVSYKNSYSGFYSFMPQDNNKNTYVVLHKKRLSVSKIEHISKMCLPNQQNDNPLLMILAEIQRANENIFVILHEFDNSHYIHNILYSESSEFWIRLPFNLVIMDEYKY